MEKRFALPNKKELIYQSNAWVHQRAMFLSMFCINKKREYNE